MPLTAEPKRSDTYLDPWYPEDATVEVWSQDADDLCSGIERSLLTPTTFIAAAIPMSPVQRKSSYGLKTSPLPVKSSARSSKAHPSSSCRLVIGAWKLRLFL
jgi:hypothetical protein